MTTLKFAVLMALWSLLFYLALTLVRGDSRPDLMTIVAIVVGALVGVLIGKRALGNQRRA